MVFLPLVMLLLSFLVSLAWALWPLRRPRVLVGALLLHLAVSTVGFVSLYPASGSPSVAYVMLMLVAFGPGFLIALFRLLLNTTEWGERLRTSAARRRR